MSNLVFSHKVSTVSLYLLFTMNFTLPIRTARKAPDFFVNNTISERKCYLLRELPRELRDMIYNYVLFYPAGLWGTNYPYLFNSQTTIFRHKSNPLKLVCKQLHAETTGLLRKLNDTVNFTFRFPPPSDVRFTGLLEFLGYNELLTSPVCQNITRINIYPSPSVTNNENHLLVILARFFGHPQFAELQSFCESRPNSQVFVHFRHCPPTIDSLSPMKVWPSSPAEETERAFLILSLVMENLRTGKIPDVQTFVSILYPGHPEWSLRLRVWVMRLNRVLRAGNRLGHIPSNLRITLAIDIRSCRRSHVKDPCCYRCKHGYCARHVCNCKTEVEAMKKQHEKGF